MEARLYIELYWQKLTEEILMNIRVVLVTLTILVFAVGFGTLNYMADQELNLMQAYEEGNIEIIQKTDAGVVPHELLLFNNGERPIKVERGYTLISDASQDMVIAREEIIAPGKNNTIMAYSLTTEANVEQDIVMSVSKKAPELIQDLIDNTNPQNPTEALKTQLKIWILTSDGEVNIYQGEAQSLSREQRISFSALENNITTARIELMAQFNLTEEEMANMSANIDLMRTEQSWWGSILEFFRG